MAQTDIDIHVSCEGGHRWYGDDSFFDQVHFVSWEQYETTLTRSLNKLGFVPRVGDTVADRYGETWRVKRVLIVTDDEDRMFGKIYVDLETTYIG